MVGGSSAGKAGGEAGMAGGEAGSGAGLTARALRASTAGGRMWLIAAGNLGSTGSTGSTGNKGNKGNIGRSGKAGDRCGARLGGFTLIEVLVAMLVLAIGALGAGAMLLQARRASEQSARISAAVLLAARAADGMRANPAAMAAADADNPYLQLDYDSLADAAGVDSGAGAGAAEPSADCSIAACDSGALAQADLAALRHSLLSQYPPGRMRICRDSAVWDSAGAALRWDCDGVASAPVVIKIGWRVAADVVGNGAAASDAAVLVAVPLVSQVAAGALP